ncbi:hypothetical protein DNTS_022126 [Danionella cerebrum]|uniref:Uncharacterized protein n=1 Tax=Danionella cerebrum TaxID=2873325 RepID=A0A553R0L8_9TELE|nr:hypothetical protein DNTS_022126 [Danionella translucida]
MKELLQVPLQLVEVHGGDEALRGFAQAVAGQLQDLMVDEVQDSVGQRENLLWAEGLHEVTETALHLRRGLQEQRNVMQALRAAERGWTGGDGGGYLGEALPVNVVHHEDLVVVAGVRAAGAEHKHRECSCTVPPEAPGAGPGVRREAAASVVVSDALRAVGVGVGALGAAEVFGEKLQLVHRGLGHQLMEALLRRARRLHADVTGMTCRGSYTQQLYQQEFSTVELGVLVPYPEEGREARDQRRPSLENKGTFFS